MNLVLFVNGAVKPYVDWLENRKRYGTSQEKYRRRGSVVLHTGPHAMQSNPYSGLFYRRVILTLKFIPHEHTVYTLESVLDHIYVFLDRTLSALLRTVRTHLLIRTLSHQN